MTVSIASITFDCRDAAALAGFWARLLDRAVDPDANEYFASIDRQSGGTGMMFIQVPDKNPGKNVVHLDLTASGPLPEAVERAIGLGAKHIGDFDEHGINWATLADPEGNLFDIAAG